MFFNRKFILASSSFSRFQILKKNKLSFHKVDPICNESYLKKKMLLKKISHRKISLELARSKSKSVSKEKKDILVLGSDTIISFRGEVLNKAKNIKEARKTILNFSGKKHNIYSSASVFLNNNEVWHATQKSIVKIRELTETDADLYLKKAGKNILSSVGCYQAESLGPSIIESIEGDFFNVLGLPLFPFLLFLNGYKNSK